MVSLLVNNVMASIKIAMFLWSLDSIEGKGKITLSMSLRHIVGVDVKLYSFLASTLIGGELLASRRGCFTAGIHLNLDSKV